MHSIYMKSFVTAIVVIFSILVGFRDKSIGTDTTEYTNWYIAVSNGQQIETEPLYLALMNFFTLINLDIEIFFSFTVLLTSYLILKSSNLLNLRLNTYNTPLKLFTYSWFSLILSPVFYSVILNGIRQGIATGFLFLAWALLLRNKKLLASLACIFAVAFHQASIVFIPPLLLFRLPPSIIFSLICFLSSLYAFNLSEDLIKNISIFSNIDIYDKIISYGKGASYKSGVRLDFLLFSLSAGCLLNIIARFTIVKHYKQEYFRIIQYYWLSLIPFTLFGFGAYSNRLLIPSWLFLSIAFALCIVSSKFKATETKTTALLLFVIMLFYFIFFLLT